MKVTSNQDTQLHFLMTVIQHLLRVSFEGLEIRWAISWSFFSYVKQFQEYHYVECFYTKLPTFDSIMYFLQ